MDKDVMPLIKHQTYIRVEPDNVYKALLSEEDWNKWFTEGTTIQMNDEGLGSIRFRWGLKLELEDGGKIVKAIPGKTFSFQWHPGETVTTVTFQLFPYKEGTLIKLQEEGYSYSEKDVKACIGCAAGWGEALTLLKMYLEYRVTVKEDLILDA